VASHVVKITETYHHYWLIDGNGVCYLFALDHLEPRFCSSLPPKRLDIGKNSHTQPKINISCIIPELSNLEQY
jgi:hypothetical protein